MCQSLMNNIKINISKIDSIIKWNSNIYLYLYLYLLIISK